MTLRLISLMSAVLLLSLAAFGLLMQHYQDQVMQEVARTASAVGKATLSTMDVRTSDANIDQAAWIWAGQGRSGGLSGGPSRGPLREPLPDGSPGQGSYEGHIVIDATFHAEDEARMVRRVLRHTGALTPELRSRLGAAGAHPCELDNLITDVDFGEELQARVLVDLEEVHVETDPADGSMLMLKIPTLAREALWQQANRNVGSPQSVTAPNEIDDIERLEGLTIAEEAEGVASTAEGVQMANRFVSKEIQLPIAVDDYQELFASIRKRSVFLFMGVLLVGVAMTTGLATRFTRPIRRLDQGLRQLSEGDLDAQVDVQGKDEIARLGLAFNEMASRLRSSRDRAREVVRREKLSALGGLAAGVAHDVRNPLHSIGLTLQHLQETCRPEAEERAEAFDQATQIIRGEIRRLDGLVGNFLRFTRSDPKQRQPVDLGDLLQETAGLIRKEAEWRQIEVHLDLLETLPQVWADGEALRSSILNLVLNSFEAMPDGGSLTLRMGVDRGCAVVEVRDTGRGIPEEDLERVFEFAYTTRESGTGLGLAMVHQCVVEDHDGRVDIESAPGQGTAVRIAIPIHTQGTDEEAAR